MDDQKSPLLSIGKKSRQALQVVLAKCKDAITPKDVHKLLKISKKRSYELLSYWKSRGWLQRVRQGLYVPVPLESPSANRIVEDPWILASKLFPPCYIGGWTAAQYWDLTEQIFETVVIYTIKSTRLSQVKIGGVSFLIKRISKSKLLGTQKVWRGQIRVEVSDPSRTIIDFLDVPKMGGGIRFVGDVLIEYLHSKHKNLPKLIEYATRLQNRTIFKRLGFLLEMLAPEEKDTIDQCLTKISKGKSQLDPVIQGKAFSSKWKLWYPKDIQNFWKQS